MSESLRSNHAQDDLVWMRLALVQAQQAATQGEVPVGAVIVHQGEVIAQSHNAPVSCNDPTAHAEIVALRQAAQNLGNYRLEECTLYVTLEPCSMCAGALINARLKRVVYGAHEPRTGAAGSVVNLFGNQQLNTKTEVTSGILADQSAALLQDFFKVRRVNLNPLKEDALRTPLIKFESLKDYPWQAHYLSEPSVLNGWRMHYLDEQPVDASHATTHTYLCLHDHTQWSYAFRHLIPHWLAQGHRVIAPDLIGFGKSDKPKKESAHTVEFHRQCVLALIEQLDLNHIVIVGSGWGASLGMTLPILSPHRFIDFVDVGELPKSKGDDLPFVDKGHRAAPRAFGHKHFHQDMINLLASIRRFDM